MLVRYVLGRAGKGKSTHIFSEIKDQLEKDNQQKILLLVPEQYTLQAERDLLRNIDQPGMIQVEVLSITSLSNRVLNEAGGMTRTLLNEQGRNMVLRKLIEEHIDDLTIFKKTARQEGFVIKLGDMIKELKQNDISASSFVDTQKLCDENSILGQKIHDIGFLYEQLEGYLAGRYIDTEDRMNLFIKKLPCSSLVRGARVYIDGFTTFSSQSLRVIREIMLLAEETTISFTVPVEPGSRDRDLFQVSYDSFQRVQRMVRESGVKEENITIDARPANQYKSPDMVHLESELYAYPFRQYKQEVKNLRLFAGMNIYTEVEHTAADIVSLVRDNEDYRWRDIAVVCNDLGTYGPIIKRVFRDYDIPIFLDQKRSVMDNPMIRFILAALDIVERNYQYDDMFAYIKTGFSDLEIEEYETLENYVLHYGIRGNRWKEEFNRGEEEEKTCCEVYRLKVAEPLLKLEKNLKKQTLLGDQVRVLFAFLQELQVPQKLEAWIERFRSRDMYDQVLENAQIWNIILDTLDQLVEIMGDQEAAVKDFRRILEAGFQSYEMGIIPTTVDQVLVGSIQRSKSAGIKALYVIGVNDGVLPSRMINEDILGSEEKETLRNSGLDFGIDEDLKIIEEKFLIYNALASPSQRSSLSSATSDTEGRALRPSLLMERFRTIFPGVVFSDDLIATRENQLSTVSKPESTFKYLLENLRMKLDGREIFDFWWDVYDWYFQQEAWDQKRKAVIQALFHQNQVESLGQLHAKGLYSWPIRSSVSRLERFVQCPFSHFIQYGLRPGERKTYDLANPDIGDIFHRSLQQFADRVAENEWEWRDLEREQSDQLMDEVMETVTREHGNGVLNSSYRYQYLARRLGRISRRAAWTLTQHIKKGEFEPVGIEMAFGVHADLPPVAVELANGDKVLLEGRIDRVDRMDEGENSYIKIIDYKSGVKNLKLSDVYHGMSLQLMVYLLAVLSMDGKADGKNLKPGGVFYFRIDDPFVESEGDVIEAIEREIQKKLKMTGLVVEDLKVVKGMDREIEQHSEVIPVSLKKDGSFDVRSSVLSEEDFLMLLQHVNHLLAFNGQEILGGCIDIHPVKYGQFTACQYCKYQSICQFDRQLEGNEYRNLRYLRDDEVIEKLKEGGDQK